MADDHPMLSPVVRAEIAQGRKLDAIKRLRADTGLELARAHRAVNDYIARDPALRAAYAARQAGQSTQMRVVLAVALALVVLAAVIVFAR